MTNFKTSMKTSYLVSTDVEQAVDKYIFLDALSIFASFAVFWRVRMAIQNTNNAASEMLYNRTVLRGYFIF